MTDWSFDAWNPIVPDWGGAGQGNSFYDNIDFHVDLGCGKVKKGKIGIDRYPAPGVNIVMDIDSGWVYSVAENPNEDAAPVPVPRRWTDIEPLPVGRGLPFPDNSIESLISHHTLEHIGEGFMPLMEEIYRVLKPNAFFRAITPLFPSGSAVEDPDHCRYFMDGTWDAFGGTPGETPQNCWCASFSVPYSNARFDIVDKIMSPPVPIEQQWGPHDRRELRVAMRVRK